MKFDSQLVRILKNFSTINKSILFRPGTEVSTLEPNKVILGRAKITQEIPKQFAIYDLPQFLGVLSLFNDPDVEFGEQSLTLKEGKDSVSYKYAAEDTITYPTKDLTIISEDVLFDITADEISKLLKAASILGAKLIAIRGKDGKLTIGCEGDGDKGKDGFKIALGDTDKTFEVYLKLENIRTIPADYKVMVTAANPIKFIRLSNDTLTYFVAIEAKQSNWVG